MGTHWYFLSIGEDMAPPKNVWLRPWKNCRNIVKMTHKYPRTEVMSANSIFFLSGQPSKPIYFTIKKKKGNKATSLDILESGTRKYGIFARYLTKTITRLPELLQNDFLSSSFNQQNVSALIEQISAMMKNWGMR